MTELECACISSGRRGVHGGSKTAREPREPVLQVLLAPRPDPHYITAGITVLLMRGFVQDLQLCSLPKCLATSGMHAGHYRVWFMPAALTLSATCHKGVCRV